MRKQTSRLDLIPQASKAIIQYKTGKYTQEECCKDNKIPLSVFRYYYKYQKRIKNYMTYSHETNNIQENDDKQEDEINIQENDDKQEDEINIKENHQDSKQNNNIDFVVFNKLKSKLLDLTA